MFKNLACKLHICKLSKLEVWEHETKTEKIVVTKLSCPKCGRHVCWSTQEFKTSGMKQVVPMKEEAAPKKATAKKATPKK